MKNNKDKPQKKRSALGNCVLNFLLAVLLSIVFLAISLPFMERVNSVIQGEIVKTGGINLNRVLLIFAILTGFTIVITFYKRAFRLAALFLVAFWLMGLGFVLLVANDTTLDNSNTYICGKSSPSTTKPEFERAVSLILQRHEQYIRDNSDLKKDIDLNTLSQNEFNRLKDEVKYNLQFYSIISLNQNCINIDYESSGKNIEGIFLFDPSSTSKELKINVAPKFESKDDLLTATLLSHELQHVADFIINYPKIGLSEEECFQTEERAFGRETWFFSMLNQEEKNSIIARAKLYDSEEISSLLAVEKLVGETGEETTKAISNFVRNDPDYIKQCKK